MKHGSTGPPRGVRFEGGSGAAASAPSGRLVFFKEFLKSPKELGTCFKSSAALCRAMTEGLGLESARAVVELGAGDGPLTRRILQRTPRGCRFFAVEQSESLARALQNRFSGLHVHAADAAGVVDLCEQEGITPGTVDCVVSSLPFLLFQPELQERILASAAAILRPVGVFTTLTYRPEGLLPGVRPFRRRMEKEFSIVRLSKIVLGNVPPAFVYRCWK